MRFRPQRGSLAEAMAEMCEMPATKAALAAHLHCDIGDIEVKPYAYDQRIELQEWMPTWFIRLQEAGLCS